MDVSLPRRAVRPSLVLLAVEGVAVVAAYLAAPHTPEARTILSDVAGAVVGFSAGLVVLGMFVRPDAWRAAVPFGFALIGMGAVSAGLLFADLAHLPRGPHGGSGLVVLAFLPVAALLLAPLQQELADHFAPEDRREVVLDIALIAAAATSIAYFALRPAADPGPVASLAAMGLAAAAMTTVTAWAVLAFTAPYPMHLGLFGVMGVLGAGGFAFAYQWVRGAYSGGHAALDLPLHLGLLGLAALLVLEPDIAPATPRPARAHRTRPALTAAAVLASCLGIVVVAAMALRGRLSELEASVLVLVVGAALAARILVNQVRSSRSTRDAQLALEDKDRALQETDAALTRLRDLNESLRDSEERLRLLFDAAVDGIVELDAKGFIRQTNEAFSTMMGLPPEDITGRSWEEMASLVEGGGSSLEALPVTGQATVEREGQSLHLETRSSDLPGPDKGRLLVVRDVTAARVADQTIRSLFHFLQDRDEDRTRLLSRTNAAIEAERNRIARDLHDGPVQGVAAATLSLEAVLLRLKSGKLDEAVGVLEEIRGELAEETESLRRLLSDLRPPVLDERGLVPALREVLARFARDFDIKTRFSSRSLVDIPPELETLAYRIVQEALSNAGKHSEAAEVNLSVEAVAGQLRIEIVDDGKGFDPARVRDYLRAGRVGLASMRERTELANGSFLVRSRPGAGTTIVATLPLDVTSSPSQPALA